MQVHYSVMFRKTRYLQQTEAQSSFGKIADGMCFFPAELFDYVLNARQIEWD